MDGTRNGLNEIMALQAMHWPMQDAKPSDSLITLKLLTIILDM